MKNNTEYILKKGDMVFLERNNQDPLEGILMEDETQSPTRHNPERKVARVKWDDNTVSIETSVYLIRIAKNIIYSKN